MCNCCQWFSCVHCDQAVSGEVLFLYLLVCAFVHNVVSSTLAMHASMIFTAYVELSLFLVCASLNVHDLVQENNVTGV